MKILNSSNSFWRSSTFLMTSNLRLSGNVRKCRSKSIFAGCHFSSIVCLYHTYITWIWIWTSTWVIIWIRKYMYNYQVLDDKQVSTSRKKIRFGYKYYTLCRSLYYIKNVYISSEYRQWRKILQILSWNNSLFHKKCTVFLQNTLDNSGCYFLSNTLHCMSNMELFELMSYILEILNNYFLII